MNKILEEAKNISSILLEKEVCSDLKIPESGGVYVIRSPRGVYVGKAKIQPSWKLRRNGHWSYLTLP